MSTLAGRRGMRPKMMMPFDSQPPQRKSTAHLPAGLKSGAPKQAVLVLYAPARSHTASYPLLLRRPGVSAMERVRRQHPESLSMKAELDQVKRKNRIAVSERAGGMLQKQGRVRNVSGSLSVPVPSSWQLQVLCRERLRAWLLRIVHSLCTLSVSSCYIGIAGSRYISVRFCSTVSSLLPRANSRSLFSHPS